MKRIHIVGRKNSGKTTLVVELVEWFKTNGYCVGTIKHTHHQHELDTPGKDSFRHREAGANAVGILSPGLNAVFWEDDEKTDKEKPEQQDRYSLFEPLMQRCDFILVEGDLSTQAPKLEVWRAENTESPMVSENESIAALVTDDTCSIKKPTLRRDKIEQITSWILNELEVEAK